jgi:twinkle protein
MRYSIEEIKQVANIVDVISPYLELKKNGANYVCKCPFHNEKSDSFTVSASKNIFKCFGCGESGNSIDFLMKHKKIELNEALLILAEKYNIMPENEFKEKPIYFKPIKHDNNYKLSQKFIKWFESRKISEQTIYDLNITEGLEFMPQTKQNENTVQFNYLVENDIINTKYRDARKNFKLRSGGKLILYNLNSIKNTELIAMVEGEMDCAAIHESGFKSVVSVPNGAGVSKNNLTYLDNSIEFLPENAKYLLAFDNDMPGNNLRDEVARRLGFENCAIVTFKDCKDANECLIKYGKSVVIECLNNPKDYPIIGVFDANDIKEDIYNFYNNGLPPGCGIGMAEIDMHIKFQVGYMTIITGIPGHGKSEFLDFLLCRLNISHGWKTALYSPENHPLELHFSKMAEKMIGKPFEGSNRMNHLDLDAMIKYHADNFYFINPEDDFTIDSILSAAKALVRKKGIKALVIDAWNKLDHKQGSDTETSYISKALDKLALFCERNQIHLFLVAHPTKIQKDKKTNLYEIPNLYSISGSANFYNKTANGLTVYINRDTGGVEIHVQKVKFKHWGKPGCIHLGWDYKNGRYYKGTPKYDNWLYYDQSKQVEQNNDFLTQTNDIVTSNDNEPEPF